MRQGATPPLLGGLARSPALGAPANGQVRPTHRSAQAPPKRLAAGPSPAGGASLRPPYGEGIFAGHSTFPSTLRSPERSPDDQGEGPARSGRNRVFTGGRVEHASKFSARGASLRQPARGDLRQAPGAFSGQAVAPSTHRNVPPGALPAPLRAPLLPSARSARAAPTLAHWWIGPVAMWRSPH